MKNLNGLVIDALCAGGRIGGLRPAISGITRRQSARWVMERTVSSTNRASQRLRKRIEEAFAWIQATAGQNPRTEENQIPRSGARQGFPLRGPSL
jgi:hypothetical protein